MKTLPKSNIEYLTHHWPVVTGCSFWCPWCWARKNAAMRPTCHGFQRGAGLGVPRIPMPFFLPVCHPDRLDLPLRRKKPARIGVCFTGDLFGPEVPNSFIAQTFRVMGESACSLHEFFVLTKRAGAMKTWVGLRTFEGRTLPNVFLGVSVTTQADADERIPLLLATPAAKRWVSVEPMLGPVDLTGYHARIGGLCKSGSYCAGLDFVVCGSIDRPTAQYPAPRREWIDSVVEQCRAAGVPVWVKNNAQPSTAARLAGIKRWPQELPR